MMNLLFERKRIIKLFILGILLSLLPITHSRATKTDIRFDHFSLEQGLSQTKIHCIFQDKEGFMWFGTENGLNKYDGYNVTVYKLDSENPNSLSHNIILAIYEDRTGLLWIGTEGGGLNAFDRETGRFTRYLHNPEQPGSLSGNEVLSIYEDHTGTLWVGTWDDGLNRFDRDTGQFISYQMDPDDPFSISHNIVSSIYEDREGNLWIGTGGGGLNVFARETGKFRHYRNIPEDPESLSDDVVASICEDHAGMLWIGTWGGGLNRFDRKTGQFITYRNDPFDPQSLSRDEVWFVYEDSTGTLWVGTSDGLNRLDPENEHFIRYHYSPDDPHGLSDSEILSIYEDRSGVLWFGTVSGGLNVYNRRAGQFLHYKPEANSPHSLNHPDVTAIYEDRSGKLWIGTDGGGLNRFNQETEQFVHYTPDLQNPHSLSHFDVSAIYEDSSGTLWIGTGGGLNKFDRKTEQFIQYRYDSNNPHSLSSDLVSSICEDAPGKLWIATEEGLNRFDQETEQFMFYSHDPVDPYSLSDNRVTIIKKDSSGVLWIGTFGGGLNALSPQFQQEEHAQFVHYRNDPADPQSLSHNIVLSIYEDSSGILWIGTGKGLDRFDRTTETFAHYIEKDGLPNNAILGILEDNNGTLWLSTLGGLSQFDPDAETFKNYNASDGLQSNEFNDACYKSRTGALIFGGINGFNLFYPENIKDNPYIPPVALTSLTQGGENLVFGKAIERARNVRLNWRYNFFEFEFAALNYVQPEKNQYAYKLEGFDGDWNYSGTRRFGRYTNLPGGTYRLRMKGSNNDGIWNEEGIDIRIHVDSPPWRSWWAYSLYVLAATGAILGYVRYTTKRRQLEEAIRLILEGTAMAIGEKFFRSLASNLASALHVRFVLVSECIDSPPTKARTLAFWTGNNFAEDFEYDLDEVLYNATGGKDICYYANGVQTRFPEDEIIAATGAESYLRVPLVNVSGDVTGHIVVMDVKPIQNTQHTISVLKIFAARAEAELERKRTDGALNASLQEKETLLKEIHHRVKNNLQVISSLLGMQSKHIQDTMLALMFKESQNRIKSMALIHEKLYRSSSLAKVDFSQYIKDLGTYLCVSYGIEPNTIILNTHVEKIFLDIDTAISCGMIVNELVSNALKHAFPNGKKGEIHIGLSKDNNTYTLTVQDTGIGFPKEIDVQDTESLGLKLVHLFTEQLEGTMTLDKHDGTTFTVTFT